MTERAIVSIVARPSKMPAIVMLAHVRTFRQPNFSAASPDSGIVRSEPMPTQRRSIPSTSSPTLRRAFKYGTSGAHEAEANPPRKNIDRTARCSARPGFLCPEKFIEIPFRICCFLYIWYSRNYIGFVRKVQGHTSFSRKTRGWKPLPLGMGRKPAPH